MPFKRSIRLKDFDYRSDGAYFVTICTFNRANIISESNKKLLKRCLYDLEKRFPGLTVNTYAFVSNHCHIILIFNGCKIPLSRAIQVFKSISTLQLKRSGFQGQAFWQKNYYEHVVRSEEALNAIREYIIYNPEKERIKMEDIKKWKKDPKHD